MFTLLKLCKKTISIKTNIDKVIDKRHFQTRSIDFNLDLSKYVIANPLTNISSNIIEKCLFNYQCKQRYHTYCDVDNYKYPALKPYDKMKWLFRLNIQLDRLNNRSTDI